MLKSLSKIFLFILIAQNLLFAREINIDSLIKEAAVSSKHLFVWLHKTDCGYCENMREFTLENEIVKSFIDKNFIFVHINVYEKDSVKYKDFKGNGLEFAKDIGYNFYPASLFFNDEGEMIFAEVGFIDSNKNPNEKRFYKILNYIKSNSYENTEYSDYKYKFKEEF
jgi:thioredoxin-related protein